MLERVWLWYLAPALLGLTGLTLSTKGVSTFSLLYLPSVVLLCTMIGWINRRTARMEFRAHAERLQRQIDFLTGEEGA